jgi:hypothetical protein
MRQRRGDGNPVQCRVLSGHFQYFNRAKVETPGEGVTDIDVGRHCSGTALAEEFLLAESDHLGSAVQCRVQAIENMGGAIQGEGNI